MSDNVEILVSDRFTDQRHVGRVVGTSATDGVQRRGVDRHRSLAVDHGALRITSLTRPGWGSTAIAYGPFPPIDGLAVGALLLNGHNTSQAEPLGESLRARYKRWLKGNETEHWRRHLWSWVRHGRRRWTLRRFRHWTWLAWSSRRGSLAPLDENLSIGFLDATSSTDPLHRGNSFVMHATGAFNGELWVSDVRGPRRVLPSVQNIPLYLLTIRRGDWVIHLAGSVDSASGLPTLPQVRPLALVPAANFDNTYAALQQAVSGQIGFAVDTRVFEMTVATTDWPSQDTAPGVQTSFEKSSEMSRSWTVPGGAGLIAVLAPVGASFELDWRADEHGRWVLTVSPELIELCAIEGANRDQVATCAAPHGRTPLDVQITDNGRLIGVYVDSQLVFKTWVIDDRNARGDGVHIRLRGGGPNTVAVYPRTLTLPASIRPEPLPMTKARPGDVVVDDAFLGPSGNLHGRRVPGFGVVWAHTSGSGRIEIGERSGARIDATRNRPLVGRVAYTVPHPTGDPVEIEVDVLPPGSDRNQGERGRAGVIFWDDDDNSLVVATWLDDHYQGASISSFFRLGGFEDLYDAVWTNVGDRIVWGTPYRLNVVFDGDMFTASVNGELVLYRRLTDVHPDQVPLRIHRIGIVGNWEWGTDTGSTFRRFTATAAEPTHAASHDTTTTRGNS